MSILKDRIRPLDPSSLQEFLAHDHEAETEEENVGASSEPEEGISLAEGALSHVGHPAMTTG